MKSVLVLTIMALVVTLSFGLRVAPKLPKVQLAAAAVPSLGRVDWQQWDSFLTTVVKKFGADFSEDRREQLTDVFLDARYQLVQSLSAGASDPVPQLFLDTWSRLSPVVSEAVPGLSQQTASQYTSFITAMDGLSSLGGLGQRLGFFSLSPEALRGAARLLGTPANTDPLEYNVDIDSTLRNLLGFTGSLPTPQISPAVEQGRLYRSPMPGMERASAIFRPWLVRAAFAAELDLGKLNQWVPDSQELQDYLTEVRTMLEEMSDRVLEKSKLASQYQPLYRQIVFAAAWQESCWRQFIKKGDKLTPLSSTTGDVGLMQVNRTVWRGMYDLKGLSGDIGYNGNAGGEILFHYLTRYAIRKNEDKQPGGQLARATYSAYNGGPGALGRYRSTKTSPTWKKVDDAFWEKFQAVSSGREMEVKRCYGP